MQSVIRKVADAATAQITVRKMSGALTMTIADDGKGFDYRQTMIAPQRSRGFGLTGLAERVRILGGQFACDSAPSQGTRLNFEIPIPAKNEK